MVWTSYMVKMVENIGKNLLNTFWKVSINNNNTKGFNRMVKIRQKIYIGGDHNNRRIIINYVEVPIYKMVNIKIENKL